MLRDGLPDWRQPIYYYRKVKKMGLLESFLLLFVVFTLGHYVVSWAVYLEKIFEMASLLPSSPIHSHGYKVLARCCLMPLLRLSLKLHFPINLQLCTSEVVPQLVGRVEVSMFQV